MFQEKRITLKNIAEMAGVSKAAVSGVLNNSVKINCSKDKREQIFKLVKMYDYAPQSVARALSTRRTYQIGFMVSTKITLGLANAYFSTLMAGVQHICQQRGYLLTVAAYDLSSIEDFVMPPKLKQQSVDGVIIAGPVAPEVVKLIQKFDIPFILFSDPLMVEPFSEKSEHDNIICLSSDSLANNRMILKYFAGLGHKKIAVSPIQHYREGFNDIIAGSGLQLIEIADQEMNKFEYGSELAKKWLAIPDAERYTAMHACDQVCCGFLSALQESGKAKCPEDISLISGESILCKLVYPKLTAIDNDVYSQGCIGANAIINVLDNKVSLNDARKEAKNLYKAGTLIVRDSCMRKDNKNDFNEKHQKRRCEDENRPIGKTTVHAC